MTATDELRRMLTEAGVEWWPEKYYKDACTVWHANGMEWRAREQTDGRLLVGCTSLAHLTPEQAIAATLGAGTCHITPKFTCSECGHQYPTRNYESYETCDGRTAFAPLGYNVLNCKKPCFCPQCGRRVKVVGE